MDFDWDEPKRLANLEKHGLDFLDVWAVFEDKHVIVPSTYGGDENRSLAIGLLESRFVTVVFTLRNEIIRVISFRRASYAERQKYEELLNRGT